MDVKTFVLLSNQFKKERDQLREAQQKIQAQFKTVQKFQDGTAHFKKEVEGQADTKFLTRILPGNSLTRSQFIQLIGVSDHTRRKSKFHYHFIGKIEEIL